MFLLVKRSEPKSVDEACRKSDLPQSFEKNDENAPEGRYCVAATPESSSSFNLNLASETSFQTPLEKIKPPNPFKVKQLYNRIKFYNKALLLSTVDLEEVS